MSDTREDRQEAAATRRRWVTLAEVVAVAGVVIGALTLWNSWEDRRDAQADKAATATMTERERARVDLTATVADGGRALRLADAHHEISDATIAFPRALGIAAARPAGDPAIEAAPFADALLKLTDGGADARTGRLPVLITVRYVDGDDTRTATGLYDVVWRTEGRVLRGRVLRLESLRLRARGGTEVALDAAWAREKP